MSNTGVRCAQVTFPGYMKKYSYLTDIPSAKKGDIAVVNVRGEFKTVKIASITKRIPAIASSWLVDIVDTSRHEALESKRNINRLEAELQNVKERLCIARLKHNQKFL